MYARSRVPRSREPGKYPFRVTVVHAPPGDNVRMPRSRRIQKLEVDPIGEGAVDGGSSQRIRVITLGLGLAAGVLAYAVVYHEVGSVGALAIAVPALVLLVWLRRYLTKACTSVAQMERSNMELRRRNADLRDLAEFASGLPAQTYDSGCLASYVQAEVGRIVGGRVVVTVHPEGIVGTPLESSIGVVGGIALVDGDLERWERLRGPIEGQLAVALEAAAFAEQTRAAYVETIEKLSRSLDAKDYYTGGHAERVSDIAVGLAKRLGYSGAELNAIEIGALMHDVGKIGIPESILHKASPLDNDEWIVMKRHPVISELILSDTELSPFVLEIARSSHERIDGQGYPDGLSGDDIPLPARIVLVADAFEALTTDRPYRRARRPKAALEEIVANKNTQFCPQVVAALERLYREEPNVLGEVGLTVVASAQ